MHLVYLVPALSWPCITLYYIHMWLQGLWEGNQHLILLVMLAPYVLRGGNVLCFMCLHRRYTYCLFVCLLNFFTCFWGWSGRSGTVGGRCPGCCFWILPKRSIPKPEHHWCWLAWFEGHGLTHVGPSQSPFPPYSFTTISSTKSFTIFYFLLFPFLTCFVCFAFPSLYILPEYSHSVSRPDVIGGD